MQIKPGHPDTTIHFDQIVHRSSMTILDYHTEADDDPGIVDLRDRFTPIRSLSSETQYQPNQGSQTFRHAWASPSYRLTASPEEKTDDVLPYSNIRPRILQSGFKLSDCPLVRERWSLAKSAFSTMWRSEHIKPTRKAHLPLPDRIHSQLEVSSATNDPWVKEGPAIVRAQIYPRPIGDRAAW